MIRRLEEIKYVKRKDTEYAFLASLKTARGFIVTVHI